MTNTPAVTHREATRVAEALGFVLKSQEGSHMQFKHPEMGKKVTIPKYKKAYGPDLFSNICRQLGVTKKDFFRILREGGL